MDGSNYGISFDGATGQLTGFAWGSDVVGWIDFALTAGSNDYPDESVRTTYQDVCTVGNVCTDGTLYDRLESCALTEVRTCINGCMDGSTCNPECTPRYGCDGDTITFTNVACETSDVDTCESPRFCSEGSQVCLLPEPAFAPDGELSAIPNLVQHGNTTRLFWEVENVSSCVVVGENGDSFSGASSGEDGKETGAITELTTYTLTCEAFGEEQSDISDEVTVRVTPEFREF